MDNLEQSAPAQNSDNQQDSEPSESLGLEQQLIDDLKDVNDSDGDSQEQTTDEETDEIEIDGAKFALPKTAAEKLKSERMMHADYTRKTQTHAEQVRVFEEQQQKRVADFEQDFADRAKLHNISETIRQYGNVDWQTAWDTDPIAAGKAQAQFQALLAEKGAMEGSIAQKQHHRALEQQQTTAKLVQEADAYVAREIPGWTEKRGHELSAYVSAEGLPMNQEVAQVLIKHPAFLKIINKAALFDQVEKGQLQQHKQQVKSQTQAKPVTRVGANTRVEKDPSNMSDAEFAAMRAKQMKQRR